MSTTQTNPREPAANASNRMVLLLIGGLPVTIILAATWLWYFGISGNLNVVEMLGTANRGVLVEPPRQLDEQTLQDATGAAVRYAELEPRWTLLVPNDSANCGSSCEASLYLTRQIHTAMGKSFNRLRRAYISEHAAQETRLLVTTLSDERPAPSADDFAAYLEREQRGLQALTLSAGGYDALFSEHAADQSTWYLVDPAGWIMMSYNSDIPFKDVISELKFLFKNSSG